ncbi:MAG: hypothetical protein NTY38_09700 [Acidobacteria bacterium]|nr:hypothetical protein [Acidobacteriota bacterium]
MIGQGLLVFGFVLPFIGTDRQRRLHFRVVVMAAMFLEFEEAAEGAVIITLEAGFLAVEGVGVGFGVEGTGGLGGAGLFGGGIGVRERRGKFGGFSSPGA